MQQQTATASAMAASASAASSSAASAPPRPPLLILYGSQTGCAQEVAERIAREARFQHFARVRCMPMDSFDRRLLPSQPLVLFVCSTTGQGEAADNMKGLYRFLLRKDLPADSLCAMRTAVFGLGDSSYPLFNAIARRLNARLAELGAAPIIPRGLGDDQADRGVDEELDPWLDRLWEALLIVHPLPRGLSIGNYKQMAGEPEAKYHVTVLRGKDAEAARERASAQAEAVRAAAMAAAPTSPAAHASAAASHAASPGHAASARLYNPPLVPMAPFLAGTPASYTPLPLRLVANRRLTPANHWQDVREIELEIPSVDEQRRRGIVVSGATHAAGSNGASTAAATTPPLSAAHRSAGAFAHSPGDVLLVHPRNPHPEAGARAWIEQHYQLDYDHDWLEIVPIAQWKREQRRNADAEAATAAASASRAAADDHGSSAMDLVMTPRAHSNGLSSAVSSPVITASASAAVAHSESAEGLDEDEEAEASEYPVLCSVRDLFEQHLDWCGTPRRFFFEQLSRFATSNPIEQEKLQELASPSFHSDFARYVTREKRMHWEVLADFKSAVPTTLGQLITLVGRLQPRQFSIASCLDAHPQRIQLLVALLAVQTPFKRQRQGVCSAFFNTLDPTREGGAFVHAWIKRPSSAAGMSFRPPADPAVPVVLIGPGTGIAAFRAMAEARALWKAEQEQRTFEEEPFAVTEGEQQEMDAQAEAQRQSECAAGVLPVSTCSPLPSPSLLPHTAPPYLVLFGNRNRAADFFWAEQWAQMEQQERAIEFHAVFSRDEEATDEGQQQAAAAASDAPVESRCKYVQHVLERDCGLDVARRLARGGVIMVAGSAKGRMTRDVRATVQRILQRYGTGEGAGAGSRTTDAWTEAQAVEYLKLMDRQRRYAVEAW